MTAQRFEGDWAQRTCNWHSSNCNIIPFIFYTRELLTSNKQESISVAIVQVSRAHHGTWTCSLTLDTDLEVVRSFVLLQVAVTPSPVIVWWEYLK